MFVVEKNRSEDMDDLDAYMLSIKSGGMNATGNNSIYYHSIMVLTPWAIISWQ